MHLYMHYLRSLKFTLKHLKRSTCFDPTIIFREHIFSLIKLYTKTISDLLRYINFGDVAACRVFVCASYAVQPTTHIQS